LSNWLARLTVDQILNRLVGSSPTAPTVTLTKGYMIDNFDLIQSIIYNQTLSDDNFFWVQIIKRRKDDGNHAMLKENAILDTLFFDHRHNFSILYKKEHIVKQCLQNNARAYVWLNKRSYEKVALQTMLTIAERISVKNYQIKDVYLSMCGKFADARNYLVDIDGDEVDKNEVAEYIKSLLKEAGKDSSVIEIPTRSGCHLIASAFNVAKLSQKYPDISVHKENPTILYIPPLYLPSCL
jgi:hypothetical protein